MIDEVLRSLDLSKEEVEVYLTLLEKGTQNAQSLSKNTSVKRTYVYKICEQLLKKGLVTFEKAGRATVFAPKSPDHLLSLAQTKKEKALQSERALEGVLQTLQQKYFAVDDKPLVQVSEGLLGLKKIYKNILDEKDNILLFRSIYDDKRPDLDETITSQIAKQKEVGIHVRTITPLEIATKDVYLNHDKENLVERHIIHSDTFKLPSQIIVYNTKVAIISLKKEIISTLIDNKDIADTFRHIFDQLWESSTDEHEEIVKNWR